MSSKEEKKFSERKPGLYKEDIQELHYIVALNEKLLISIFQHGLLSHNRASEFAKDGVDISNPDVQKIRAQKMAKGLPLHDYVNLYLNAHNAMMYSLTRSEAPQAAKFCVLRIKPNILNVTGAVMSSRNAACGEAEFFLAKKEGVLYPLDSADCLTRPNYATNDVSLLGNGVSGEDIEKLRNQEKAIRQAEALIPHRVSPSYIGAIFVSSEQSKVAVENILNTAKDRWLKKRLSEEDFPLNNISVVVHPSIFFVGSGKYVNLEKFEPLSDLLAAQKRKSNKRKAERSNSEAEVSENKMQGVRLPLVRALSKPSTSPKRIKAERSRSVGSKEASVRSSQFDDALPPTIPRGTYSSLTPLMNNASGGGEMVASSSSKKETKFQKKVTVPTTKRAKKFLAAARNNMQITQFFTSSEPTLVPPMSGSLVGNSSMSLSRSSGGGPAAPSIN
jgi:hypothetical protein